MYTVIHRTDPWTWSMGSPYGVLDTLLPLSRQRSSNKRISSLSLGCLPQHGSIKIKVRWAIKSIIQTFRPKSPTCPLLPALYLRPTLRSARTAGMRGLINIIAHPLFFNLFFCLSNAIRDDDWGGGRAVQLFPVTCCIDNKVHDQIQ